MMALRENVDGTIWTTTHLTAQSTIEKIDTEVVSAYSAANKLLAPAVEKALRASTFKSSCAGKSVHVAFRYTVAGARIANPTPSVRDEPPNVVWIESQPPLATQARSTQSKATPAKK
jgi:hypothetical protein